MTVVQAENVEKAYRLGDVVVRALRRVSFAIEAGALVSFVGPSGSGKSTLLNLIGCRDHPTSGKLTVLGTDVSTLGMPGVSELESHHAAIAVAYSELPLGAALTFKPASGPPEGRGTCRGV
jgi:putative ABC transport system ATP-binding protein